MNIKELTKQIASINKNAGAFRDAVQSALIGCAYFAMKDGNTTPFNELLKAVGEGTRKKGITMWAELFAPVYVKEGELKLSKTTAKQYVVLNEADFAPYLEEMNAGPKWYEIAGREKVKSVWEADKYLEHVVSMLEKHGVASDVVAKVKDAEMAVRIQKAALEEMVEV